MAGQKGKAVDIDEKIMMAIVRVSERFKRESAAVFSGYGISFPQYNLLRVLEGMPGSSASIGEVSRRLLASTPNLSGIAKRLEKTGFISRGRDAEDERRTLLQLQPAGRRVLSQIRGLQEANVKAFLSACPPGQKRALLSLLKEMLAPPA